MAEFDIQGLDGVIAQMRKAGGAVTGKITRSAVRKGAVVVRNAARRGWQQVDREGTPNSIAKNVAVQFAGRTFRQTGDVMFRVGIRGGAKQYANNVANRRKRQVGKEYKTGGSTFYWRFLELGTSSIPARPVLQPALFNKGSAVLAALVRDMERQFAKLGKGPG